MATLPQSARRYCFASALAAHQAAERALAVRRRGVRVAWETVWLFQVAQAQVAQRAVGVMLDEQGFDPGPDAPLAAAAFTTSADRFAAMVDQVRVDAEFARLVASLTQDAGRAAQGVAVASRPQTGYVRMLTPPSCARCAVLSGRVYRYSTGFQRHPGCDCVMIPTTLANPDYIEDPLTLLERGQIVGLSKADQQAIRDGADFNQVVNVRRQAAGMRESGRVLGRAGRPTPEAIYRANPTREGALSALQSAGYLR